MAGHDNENASKSFWQLMLVIPGTIIGFTLLVSVFAYFVANNKSEAPADATTPVAEVAEEAATVAEQAEEVAEAAEGEMAEKAEAVAEAAEEVAEKVAAVAEDAAATENVKPVAEVEVAAAAAPAGEAKSGEEVVKAVCAMCHASGMMQSPKIGDAGQWAPRIAQGLDTMVEHAIKGYNMMPAKGGNPALSDEEVKNAVIYMANQSGGKF